MRDDFGGGVVASLTDEMEAEARKLEGHVKAGVPVGREAASTLARRIRDWVEVLRERENEQAG